MPPLQRSRAGGEIPSNDGGPALKRRIGLSQADDSGSDLARQSDIHENDVVIVMVNDAVKKGNEFRMTLRGQAAVKYRELQPLSKTLHESEHPAPPLRISDIVSDDVKVLLSHRSPRREIRILGKLSEKMA
jgi:hypothetical protein